MCFTVREKCKPFVAAEDIVVWKSTDEGDFCMDSRHSYFNQSFSRSTKRGAVGFFSRYLHFKYLFGGTYAKNRRVFGMCGRKGSSLGEEGFHSYRTRQQSYGDGGYAVKCYIPKGALYYYDPYYDVYISSSIRITDNRKDIRSIKS